MGSAVTLRAFRALSVHSLSTSAPLVSSPQTPGPRRGSGAGAREARPASPTEEPPTPPSPGCEAPPAASTPTSRAPHQEEEREPRGRTMLVTVATARSKDLRLHVNPRQSGLRLKLDIAPSTGIPVAEMRLTADGRIVDDAATLDALGIRNDAVVHLERVPLPPAADSAPSETPQAAAGGEGTEAAALALRRTMWVGVRTRTGLLIPLFVDPHQTVEQLKHDIAPTTSFDVAEMQLVFNERKLPERGTLRACGVVDSCVVHLILKVKVSIGVFVSPLCPSPLPDPAGHVLLAADAPGATWLAAASSPSPPPPAAEVVAMVAQVHHLSRGVGAREVREDFGGESVVRCRAAAAAGCAPDWLEAAPFWQSSGRVVGDEAAAALVALVDAAWRRAHGGARGDATQRGDFAKSGLAQRVAAGSTEGDFKLLLPPAALRDVVGPAAYAQMLAALFPPSGGAGEAGGKPDAVALRRTAARGRWIGFHIDDAARTVQVPLSGDAECEGGRLVFALASGRLVAASRRVGSILAHDGDVVHGVTRLTRGVRYGLYLLRERREVPALPSPALVA